MSDPRPVGHSRSPVGVPRTGPALSRHQVVLFSVMLGAALGLAVLMQSDAVVTALAAATATGPATGGPGSGPGLGAGLGPLGAGGGGVDLAAVRAGGLQVAGGLAVLAVGLAVMEVLFHRRFVGELDRQIASVRELLTLPDPGHGHAVGAMLRLECLLDRGGLAADRVEPVVRDYLLTVQPATEAYGVGRVDQAVAIAHRILNDITTPDTATRSRSDGPDSTSTFIGL